MATTAQQVIDFLAGIHGMDRLQTMIEESRDAVIDLETAAVIEAHPDFPDAEFLLVEYAHGLKAKVFTHKLVDHLLVRNSSAMAVTNPRRWGCESSLSTHSRPLYTQDRLYLLNATENRCMEKLSTYAAVGVPEQLATALVLAALALTLAPWIGGTELGPIKVPKLPDSQTRLFRVIGPFALIVLLSGFAKIWPRPTPMTPGTSRVSSLDEYVEIFFSDIESKRRPVGKLLVLDEMRTQAFMKMFGNSEWNGGTHWGKVVFDASGRSATYTNGLGRSPGRILLQGTAGGTAPIIVGEWRQEDGQSGLLMIVSSVFEPPNTIGVSWGPGRSVDEEWVRTSAPADKILFVQ